MLCAQCRHPWTVDLDWIDRWEQAKKTCPGCGVTCEAETAPRVTVDPNDLALDDDNVAQLSWYHTSTQPDWPTQNYDPAAELTGETRLRMGGDDPVASWVQRKKANALHVGTYEAAIHNMLRRIDDQGDYGAQFYLYRVRLVPTITVREGWLVDPSNFVGDVVLGEVCPPGIDVARYLNYHEDPGALSLALGRTAIASTQQIAIPVSSNEDSGWVATTVTELERATLTSPPPPEVLRGSRPMRRRLTPSPRTSKAQELTESLAERLPVNLRSQFETAAGISDDRASEEWAQYVLGLIMVVLAPDQIVAALDDQPIKHLEITR